MRVGAVVRQRVTASMPAVREAPLRQLEVHGLDGTPSHSVLNPVTTSSGDPRSQRWLGPAGSTRSSHRRPARRTGSRRAATARTRRRCPRSPARTPPRSPIGMTGNGTSTRAVHHRVDEPHPQPGVHHAGDHRDRHPPPRRKGRHDAPEHRDGDEGEHDDPTTCHESVRRHQPPVIAPPATSTASMRTTGTATKNNHDSETTARAKTSPTHGAEQQRDHRDVDHAPTERDRDRFEHPVVRPGGTHEDGEQRAADRERTEQFRPRARTSSRGTRRSTADRGTGRTAAAPSPASPAPRSMRAGTLRPGTSLPP